LVVSVANFPVARLTWHFTIGATSFPPAFATRLSHFAIGPFGASGGIKPASSLPKE
jgi:hypothetical protein